MNCNSCGVALDPTICVTLCCQQLCLDCFVVDLYQNGTVSCCVCKRILPFRTDMPIRVSNVVKEVMQWFQLTLEELPLHHREVIKGSHVDAIFIRLSQMKYDKRRVSVLNARIRTEVERNAALAKEVEELRAKLKDSTESETSADSDEQSSESGSSEPKEEMDESSKNDFEMWPDGTLRKVRRLHE